MKNDDINSQQNHNNQSDNNAQESTNQLQSDLQKCRKEAEEYLAGWKRAKADYANLERESLKRAQRLVENENAHMLTKFLSAYETLNQSLQHLEGVSDDARNGFTQAVQEFGRLFDEFGVMRIEVQKGQAVDPHTHEVLAKVKEEGAVSGTIIQEVSPGYLMNGKLLKAAKVIIAE